MFKDRPDWKLLGFVLASSYRTKIMILLSSKMAMPKQIAIETNLRIGHVSNVLKSLQNKELVECLNPEAKRGRIYSVTQKGKEVSVMMNMLDVNKSR